MVADENDSSWYCDRRADVRAVFAHDHSYRARMLNCSSRRVGHLRARRAEQVFDTDHASVQVLLAVSKARHDSVTGCPKVGLPGMLLITCGEFVSSPLLYEPAAVIVRPSIGATTKLTSMPLTSYSGPFRKDCRFGKPSCGANRSGLRALPLLLVDRAVELRAAVPERRLPAGLDVGQVIRIVREREAPLVDTGRPGPSRRRPSRG